MPGHRLILCPMSKPGGVLPTRYTHCCICACPCSACCGFALCFGESNNLTWLDTAPQSVCGVQRAQCARKDREKSLCLAPPDSRKLVHYKYGSGRSMCFRKGVKAKVYKCFEMATKYPVAPAVLSFTNSRGEAHANIQCLRHALFHTCFFGRDNLSLNLHTTPFDLGGTAKSRSFDHVRAHRRRARGPLALPLSRVHRLVRDL